MNRTQWTGLGIVGLGILLVTFGSLISGPVALSGVVVGCVGLLWFAVGRMLGEPRSPR